MADYTDNFNLKKPSQDDFYNIEDQNENMDKIDVELKTLSDSIESGAVADAVAEVNTKIGTNTDTAGTTTVFSRLKQIYDYLAGTLLSAVNARATQTSVNTLTTNIGSNADAASATGSLHAKMKYMQANSGGIKSVQRGIATRDGTGDKTTDVTISSVNMSKTFINIQSKVYTTAVVDYSGVIGYLTSSTNLRILSYRDAGAGAGSLYWEVIEFY